MGAVDEKERPSSDASPDGLFTVPCLDVSSRLQDATTSSGFGRLKMLDACGERPARIICWVRSSLTTE